MTESTINSLIAESSPILEGFLGTLLNQEATLEIGSPDEASSAMLSGNSDTYFTALSKTEGPHAFAVQFEAGWLAPVAKAMLGMDMDPSDDGAGDLISEIVSQAYGSLRNTLPAGGQLPEMYFDIRVPGNEVPADNLPDSLWRFPLTAKIGDQSLSASLFLSNATVDHICEVAAPEPEEAAPPPPPAEPIDVSTPQFQDLGRERLVREGGGNFELLAEVELNLTVELGRRRLALSEVLQLTPGSVIELEKLVGEPLEIYANGRLIAEGEAVVVDEQFGVRITNLAPAKIRAKAAA